MRVLAVLLYCLYTLASRGKNQPVISFRVVHTECCTVFALSSEIFGEQYEDISKQLGDDYFTQYETANSTEEKYELLSQSAYFGNPEAQRMLAVAFATGIFHDRIPIDPGR